MSLKRVSSIVLLLIVCSRHNRFVNRVIVCVSAVCFFSSLPNECIIRLNANQKQAKKMTQNKNRLIKLCDYEFPTELNTVKIKLSLFLLSFFFVFTYFRCKNGIRILNKSSSSSNNNIDSHNIIL